jgi:hypothetical protein
MRIRRNWRDKPVGQYVKPLHGNWFTWPPPSGPIEAIFIPFTFHHELQDCEEVDFYTLLRNSLHYDTTAFGVIHDRLRIAYFADIGSSLSPRDPRRLHGEFENIKIWVRDVLNLVRGS